MAKAPATKKKQQDWLPFFLARFPQFRAFFEGGQVEADARALFGDDLFNLIRDLSVNPGKYDFTTDEGLAAFDTLVMSTSYFQNVDAKKKAFDSSTPGDKQAAIEKTRIELAAAYGDYYLTANELQSLATDVARSGLDGVARQYYVAQKVGTRKRGRDDLLYTSEASEIQKIARQYNYKPSDLNDQIISAVTGTVYTPTGSILTADSIREKAKRIAKSAYFHLSEQLDSGLTLDEIFEPYRQAAARTLEMSPEQISLDDPLYSMALNPYENRQMSLGEWTRMIRSDSRYGYQYTTAANQAATNLGLAISRAFGSYK